MLSLLFFDLGVSLSKPHKYTKFEGEMQIFRVILYKNPLPQGAISLSRKTMKNQTINFFCAITCFLKI